LFLFFFQAEDGIRDFHVTGVQTCALPISALCLQWLDRLAGDGALDDVTVLDFGCGSGILALAALKLGARAAVGVDNDPQALTATADNAARNEIGRASCRERG